MGITNAPETDQQLKRRRGRVMRSPEQSQEVITPVSSDQIRSARIQIREILRYYCFGKNYHDSQNTLENLLGIQVSLSKMEESIENGALKNLQLIAEFQLLEEQIQLLEGELRALTDRKLETLGLTFEMSQHFYDALEGSDFSRAWEIAQQASEIQQARYKPGGEAEWVTTLQEEAETQQSTTERIHVHDRVVAKLTAVVENLIQSEPQTIKRVVKIICGLPGTGKSTIQPEHALSPTVNVDLDQIRKMLFDELQTAKLWNKELYDGEYDETNNDLMIAMNSEAKHIQKKLIEYCFEQRLPFCYQGTLKNEQKILQWIERANSQGMLVDIVHVVTENHATSYARTLQRDRGFPIDELLRAFHSLDTLVNLIEQQVAVNSLTVFDTDSAVPKRIYTHGMGYVTQSGFESRSREWRKICEAIPKPQYEYI